MSKQGTGGPRGTIEAEENLLTSDAMIACPLKKGMYGLQMMKVEEAVCFRFHDLGHFFHGLNPYQILIILLLFMLNVFL